MDRVPADADGPIRYPAWEMVEPGDDDWPDWAEEHDIIIRFLDERKEVYPGEPFPQRSLDGSPSYTSEMIGLERDVPDIDRRRAARGEQSKHLQAKGEVLGVYTDVVELDVDDERSIDEEDKAELLEAIEELRNGAASEDDHE
jgi:hypothetical protein